jgi:hypothetical protein
MGAHLISIAGLQNLPNLDNFNADYNAFQTLDFSGLTNLTYIDVSDCEELGSTGVKSINVSGCTALIDIRFDDNDLSAGFPDFSDCTSLQYFDADQCILQGSIDISNLPALQGFDLSGNPDITEVIISSNQPLGNGRSVNLSGCSSITQTALDNFLQQLASGSISGADMYITNSTLPSLETGIPALRILNGRSWTMDIDTYGQQTQTTGLYETSQDAVNALIVSNAMIDSYIYTGTSVEIGNYLYQNDTLFDAVTDGYFASYDGYVYYVNGGSGQIASREQYGV